MTARARLPYKLTDPHGAHDRPYMFLVHGMLSNHRHWDPNLPALRRFVRPVLFDLWGHGDAPAPLDDERYRVRAMLDEFERVREELGAERVLLCGQSFGASLTLRYAIEHPERVVAQVFTNSVSGLSPPEAFGSPQERAARAAAVESEGRAALESMHFHPRRARRLPEAQREQLIAAADAVDTRAVSRLMAITGPGLSVHAELHRIACPTLLVNGVRERPFQPLRDEAARRIPGLRVADVDAGHAVNLENPAAFDAAVAGFLEALA